MSGKTPKPLRGVASSSPSSPSPSESASVPMSTSVSSSPAGAASSSSPGQTSAKSNKAFASKPASSTAASGTSPPPRPQKAPTDLLLANSPVLKENQTKVQPRVSPDAYSAALARLKEGQIFYKHTSNPSEKVQPVPIAVYFEPLFGPDSPEPFEASGLAGKRGMREAGLLFWDLAKPTASNENNPEVFDNSWKAKASTNWLWDRQRDRARCIHLEDITRLIIGRQLENLRKGMLERAEDDCLFALCWRPSEDPAVGSAGKAESLLWLETLTHPHRQQWIDAFKFVYTRHMSRSLELSVCAAKLGQNPVKF